ncbi:hypothetical protein BKA67DRAFT_568730 [Truncatella angustata]|uniref:Uncharacterized protein n=1 Tax=Truncatella angustata TaxID=152316 RepID=A0A9P8UJ55_9PEZI|nr:uncharacterized protein BKA67DRAFT_568730 [Truncatella angustata]KAH6653157.1 hypothetical protein BKA67DRAFT_568730 [Truncatella angustata]
MASSLLLERSVEQLTMSEQLSQKCSVYCLFPGVDRGATKSLGHYGVVVEVVDLDSTQFQFRRGADGEQERVDEEVFVAAYMQAIEVYLTQEVVLLLSCHEALRKALHKRGVKFGIGMPAKEAKQWWIADVRQREEQWRRWMSAGLADHLEDKFDEYHKSCMAESNAELHVWSCMEDVLYGCLTWFRKTWSLSGAAQTGPILAVAGSSDVDQDGEKKCCEDEEPANV